MKHSAKITIFLLALFFVAQIVGLAITRQYIDIEKTAETGETEWKELPSVAGVHLERPEVEESTSFVYIVIAIVIGTLLLLALIRFRTATLWRVWFFLAVTICLTVAFGAFIDQVVAFILALILTYFKIYRNDVVIHNSTELFIYGGLAAIFVPILNLFAAFMLLIILSLYDMYAVWRSKHMIKLAKFQTKAKVFAGMMLPYKKIEKPVKAKTKQKKANKGKAKMVMAKVRVAVLGGGDIGFPLIFAGVVMKDVGFAQSLVIPVFVSIALLLLLLKSKKGRFYPAMPFLSIGCVVGYLVLIGLRALVF